MALQGELKSFALPDVLSLLGGTGKSGCLEVVGDARTGEVWLVDGAIVAGAVSDAPHATRAADVVFELLRLEDGAFRFEDGAQLDADHEGSPVDVASAIAAAESLRAEWADVEAVVPSMEAWILLLPELEADEVAVSAARWRAVASIGSGGSVRDLAAALELTDLDASRTVKDLVEQGLVSVRSSHGYTPPTVELDDFEQFESFESDLELEDPLTDFESLTVDERPVVMEDREDALLPEPLPGEGVSYDGESLPVGSVDGRTFDAVEQGDPAPSETAETEHDPYAMFASLEGAGGDVSPAEPMAHEGSIVEAVVEAPVMEQPQPAQADEDHGSPAPEPAAQDRPSTMDEALGQASAIADAGEDDSERGSLLKFLSTVKP